MASPKLRTRDKPAYRRQVASLRNHYINKESWQSGRSRTLGKGVYCKVPGVRIPRFPIYKFLSTKRHIFYERKIGFKYHFSSKIFNHNSLSLDENQNSLYMVCFSIIWFSIFKNILTKFSIISLKFFDSFLIFL